MGVLTKEDYERRQRNVARRNADNADILEEQGFHYAPTGAQRIY